MSNTMNEMPDEAPYPTEQEFWDRRNPLTTKELYEIRRAIFSDVAGSFGVSALRTEEIWEVETVIQLKRVADALERIANKLELSSLG